MTEAIRSTLNVEVLLVLGVLGLLVAIFFPPAAQKRRRSGAKRKGGLVRFTAVWAVSVAALLVVRLAAKLIVQSVA